MVFTYLALNVIFCVVVIIVLRKTIRVPLKAWCATLVSLLLLTLLFDNLAIWAGMFSYAPEKIVGITIGIAPIEDFFYALLVCCIVPALWMRFQPKHIHSEEEK